MPRMQRGIEKAYDDFSRKSLQYEDKKYFFDITTTLRKSSLGLGIPWNEYLIFLKSIIKVEETKSLKSSKLDSEEKELNLFVETANSLREIERRAQERK
jgi:uncharacterized protein YprB with RNaseH-like and TPR domain